MFTTTISTHHGIIWNIRKNWNCLVLASRAIRPGRAPQTRTVSRQLSNRAEIKVHLSCSDLWDVHNQPIAAIYFRSSR